MTQRNTPACSTSDFVRRVIGVPWANRACSFEKVDCWGLVVLYYRHVLGIELHQTPDYEAGADFFTCYRVTSFSGSRSINLSRTGYSSDIAARNRHTLAWY